VNSFMQYISCHDLSASKVQQKKKR
jgi:hypothetical protein